jgi:hypothetical protein
MIGKCAWRSDRVCACVETMRSKAMRLDSSGSYKSQQAKSAERSKRSDGRRTARHVVRDVPFGGASHAHFTCRRSKRATVS